MIGTGGTSPYGANGYNPEGVRNRQDKSRHGQAVKDWKKQPKHPVRGGYRFLMCECEFRRDYETRNCLDVAK
jgi:hypothetical protein